MNEQPRVETLEEFKLRIAAIVGGKPEQISGAPRPNPLLVRSKKPAFIELESAIRAPELLL